MEQIIEGKKTASVAFLNEGEFDEDEYNSALVVGEYYAVYDSQLVQKCTIRIVAMELCQWDKIPERLLFWISVTEIFFDHRMTRIKRI